MLKAAKTSKSEDEGSGKRVEQKKSGGATGLVSGFELRYRVETVTTPGMAAAETAKSKSRTFADTVNPYSFIGIG
jgi:hypothetical protein